MDMLKPAHLELLPAGRKAPLVSGADDAAHAACASQQEVIIPDSEESPGRCSQQRLQPDLHTSLPLHHVVDAQEPAAAAADPDEVDFSQTAEQAGSGNMQCKEYKGLSSVAATAAAAAVGGAGTGLDVAACMHASEPVSSGCSLEALPMHLPRKACTQQGHEEQPLQQQQQQGESKDDSRQSGGQLASLVSEYNMTEGRSYPQPLALQLPLLLLDPVSTLGIMQSRKQMLTASLGTLHWLPLLSMGINQSLGRTLGGGQQMLSRVPTRLTCMMLLSQVPQASSECLRRLTHQKTVLSQPSPLAVSCMICSKLAENAVQHPGHTRVCWESADDACQQACTSGNLVLCTFYASLCSLPDSATCW